PPRLAELDSPPERVASDRAVVGLGIVAEERQPEAALPRESPVAAAAVAARARKDRNHLMAEGRSVRGERRRIEDHAEEQAPRADNGRPSHAPFVEPHHAKSSWMGALPKSVSGKGRPFGPGRCHVGSKPRRWKIVATMSAGPTGRSAGKPPTGSLAPTTRPPFTPPPAK